MIPVKLTITIAKNGFLVEAAKNEYGFENEKHVVSKGSPLGLLLTQALSLLCPPLPEVLDATELESIVADWYSPVASIGSPTPIEPLLEF